MQPIANVVDEVISALVSDGVVPAEDLRGSHPPDIRHDA